MYDVPPGPDISGAAYEARQMQGDRHQSTRLLDELFWGFVGAVVARKIRKNWWRRSVRASVTLFLAYMATEIVTFVGVCVVQAFWFNPTANDGVPIFIWTSAVSLLVATMTARRSVLGGRR